MLVVDDGSTDGTSELLAARTDIHLITHPTNVGYGAALRSAFDFAIRGGYDILVTIDCDGQHQPQLIPKFVETCQDDDVDIVSGSRYLRRFPGDSDPPEQRRRINQIITAEVNRRLGLSLTDAFCGFKAYHVPALAKIELTETGYAMPLELWVRAAQLGLHDRRTAGPLDLPRRKTVLRRRAGRRRHPLAVYREVLDRAEGLRRQSRWQTPENRCRTFSSRRDGDLQPDTRLAVRDRYSPQRLQSPTAASPQAALHHQQRHDRRLSAAVSVLRRRIVRRWLSRRWSKCPIWSIRIFAIAISMIVICSGVAGRNGTAGPDRVARRCPPLDAILPRRSGRSPPIHPA